MVYEEMTEQTVQRLANLSLLYGSRFVKFNFSLFVRSVNEMISFTVGLQQHDKE